MHVIITLAVFTAYQVSFHQPIITEKMDGAIAFIDGLPMLTAEGKPWVPFKTLIIALPSEGNLPNIVVSSADTIKNVPLLPSPIPLRTDSSGSLQFSEPDPEVYAGKSLYPACPYRVETGHLLGVPVAKVILYPIQFSPSNKAIIFNREFEIETVGGPVQVPSEVQPFLASLVLNGEQVLPSAAKPQTDGFDYLIVTSTSLSTSWEQLIRWKTRKGHRVALRTIEWIRANYPGRDNAEKLRNYLKTAADSGLVYLLLGGDTDVLPYRKAYAMNSYPTPQEGDTIPADLYFSDLDGTWDADNDGVFGEVEDSVDMLPDIFVGRAPVSNSQDVAVFTSKVITYERDHAQDYSSTALFAASYLDATSDGGVLKDMAAENLEPEVSVMRLYEREGNLTANSLIGFINYGYNLVNHEGHGNIWTMQAGPDYIYMNAFDELSNAPKYVGVFYSTGCWVAAFDYDCIAEHFVKAPNGGGFFIGNSRYGWYIPTFTGYSATDRMDIEFYHQLGREHIQNAGAALAAVKSLYAPAAFERNTYRWSEYAVNLLGDPDLFIPLSEPMELTAQLPDELVAGDNAVQVAVYDGAVPIPGVHVTVIQNNSLLAQAITDANGTATLHIDAAAGSVEFAFWKDGYRFSYRIVPVVSNNGVQLAELRFGGDDGVLSPGETCQLTALLVNRSGSIIDNFTVNIETDQNLAVDSALFVVPQLHDGDTAVIETQLHASSTPTIACLKFIVSGNGIETDTLTRFIQIVPTQLSLKVTAIRETVSGGDVVIMVSNIGVSESGELTVHPVPLTPGLSFNVDSVSLPSLSSGESTEVELSFQMDTLTAGSPFAMFQLSPLPDTLWLSFGYRGYMFSFEDGMQGWDIEAPWHLTTHRFHSPEHSLYFGTEGSWTYPRSVTASVTSPWLTVGIQPELSFWTYFDTQAGWDFGVLQYKVQGDTMFRYLASFDGPSNTWRRFSTHIPNLHPGEMIQLRFSFYSEDNDYQLEGWYIDDISLSAIGTSTGIDEGHPPTDGTSPSLIVGQNGLSLEIRWQGNLDAIELFDAAGRKLEHRAANRGQNSVRFSMTGRPNGIYFVVGRAKGRQVAAKTIYLRN